MSLRVVDTSDGQHPEWLIPTGVFVVTLRSGNRINAYAAGWVVRVSEEPVMIQVAIWDQNYSHELAQDCDHFIVQLLAEGQQEIARHFGRNSGRDMDKLAAHLTHPGLSGIPMLEDCLAYLECKVIFHKQFGDHMILVGEVINSRVNELGKNPLIYDHLDYRIVESRNEN